MPQTPAERRWRKIVAAQDQSGLPTRAFAESRGVNPRTLAWWRSRIRRLDREHTVAVEPFTALTVVQAVQPAGTVVLALDDHKAHVIVDHQTDLRLLRRLLEAMA